MRWRAGALALLVLAGACSGGDGGDTEETTASGRRASTTTSSTTDSQESSTSTSESTTTTTTTTTTDGAAAGTSTTTGPATSSSGGGGPTSSTGKAPTTPQRPATTTTARRPSTSGTPAPATTGGQAPTTGAAPAPTPLGSARIRLTPVGAFDMPVAFASSPTSDLILVAEQHGKLKTLQGATVLDLSDQVTKGFEQGLLGVAINPTGDKFYVNYTDNHGDTRIVEYGLNGKRADTATRRELLRVDQPFANHNGGQLAFGADGQLYIALGDGGSGGDPQGNAQNLSTLLGKILRIDPRPDGERAYRIPADNPFVNRSGARPEIWAYGLRNPWRFSFDRATQDMWIGDVGQGTREEVDFAPANRAGVNWGWNAFEGNRPFKGSPPANVTPPILDYPTSGGNCAVTGGFVYRGQRVPAIAGAYLYADFCVGQIYAVRQTGGRINERADLNQKVTNLSSFGEDRNGELYVLSLNGRVSRVDPA